jgi:hypothetical protein
MENKMVKTLQVIAATSVVLLVLGWATPAESHQDQQDKGKAEEKRQQEGKPARQEQPQANKREDQQPQQQHQQARAPQDQQDNSAKQQANRQQDQQRQQDNAARQNQQQAKRQQDQPTQQQRQQQDNSARQQQQARGQQDNQSRQQQDYRSAQERSPAQTRQQQVAWQGDRAHSWQSEHRDWQQRGGYRGYRVPDDRFRSYYGQDHAFRIYSLPVVYVGGQRRFQYGGYWFGLVDPWPEYWSDNWYDDDDVYVDFSGDGYYLYNRRYPRDRIAISFYMN